MLAPPSHGSEVADLLAGQPLYKWFFGPAGQQLGTGSSREASHLLGTLDYPVGIIAGDRAVDPLAWLVLPRPNDGRVSVARTMATGMAAHLTLHVTHALMMRNPEVVRQTIGFLQSGRFSSRQAGPRVKDRAANAAPPGRPGP